MFCCLYQQFVHNFISKASPTHLVFNNLYIISHLFVGSNMFVLCLGLWFVGFVLMSFVLSIKCNSDFWTLTTRTLFTLFIKSHSPYKLSFLLTITWPNVIYSFRTIASFSSVLVNCSSLITLELDSHIMLYETFSITLTFLRICVFRKGKSAVKFETNVARICINSIVWISTRIRALIYNKLSENKTEINELFQIKLSFYSYSNLEEKCVARFTNFCNFWMHGAKRFYEASLKNCICVITNVPMFEWPIRIVKSSKRNMSILRTILFGYLKVPTFCQIVTHFESFWQAESQHRIEFMEVFLCSKQFGSMFYGCP